MALDPRKIVKGATDLGGFLFKGLSKGAEAVDDAFGAARKVVGGIGDYGDATADILRGSKITPGPVSEFSRAGRRAAKTATKASMPMLEAYPIRGRLPVRVFLGKPGRPIRKQLGSAAIRTPLIGGGLYGLGRLFGSQDGPSATEAELAGLGLDVGTLSANDLRLNRLGAAYQTAENQVRAQELALEEMLDRSLAAEANQQKFLQDYTTNTVRDIGQAYDRSAQEALRAAQEIERGGLMARGDITREGAATSAALQALAEEPAQAGTGMFTGLVPVTGDLAEAPVAAANAANIAAEATQRGVNITRDDLRAAAAMAPMISEAYGRQVDSQTAMAMAMAQIAGQKERAQTEYQETSRIGERRADLALQRAAQEDEILISALDALAPDQLRGLMKNYQNLVEAEGGLEALAVRGIRSFSDYVEASVGRETLNSLRAVAGLPPKE